MGSKRYPESGEISEFLQKHGGNHNASTASNSYCLLFRS